jgi:Lipoprotein LpqB beta-propeller domain/Sporulation and spore germination
LQPTQLYYLNTAQTHLVPDPILVPIDRPGIATTLVDELLSHPPRSVASAAVSAAPDGLDLIGNVPIGADGIAEVNLSGGTQRVSPVGLQRLSAQIAWTLRFIPGVRGVRLLDNGTPLGDIGPARFQSNASWQRFDPDAPPASRGALVSRHGVVAGIDRAVPRALAGAHVYAPTTSAAGGEVAALRRTPRSETLLMGSATGRARPRLSGPALSAPAFAPPGQVYVVSGTGAGAVVVAVPERGAIREVALPETLREQGVVDLAISRDGARIAVVAGPPGRHSLAIGILSTSGRTPSISDLVTVVPASRDASGVAWAGATNVVTTVADGLRQRAVMRISIDGYRPHLLTRAGLPREPYQVAASPGEPVLATAAGGVWSLSNQSWHRLSTGRDPSYAG